MVDSATPADELTPTRLVDDLLQLDAVFDGTRAKRDALEKQLEVAVSKLTFENFENARAIEVQLQLVNTYRSLLSDKEGSIGRRVNSKLKHAEANSAAKHSAAVAELLSRINPSTVNLNVTLPPANPAQDEARLEAAFQESGLNPVMDTELKTDPSDVNI